ncbi:hypothetical protein M758_4G160400 [Ceratodon purpureus]|nr:hypothetical protein M758_4G160400 [Ceratodon purpureus]
MRSLRQLLDRCCTNNIHELTVNCLSVAPKLLWKYRGDMSNNLGVMDLIWSWNSPGNLLCFQEWVRSISELNLLECVDNLEEFCFSGFQKWRQLFVILSLKANDVSEIYVSMMRRYTL